MTTTELLLTLNRTTVMRRAWLAAKAAARRFGGSARQYLPSCLKTAWADEKARVERLTSLKQRVEAKTDDLVARIRASKRAA